MDVWPASGRIYLVRDVAIEEVGSEFTAAITAADGGNPRLLHSARVVVRVVNCTTDDFRSQSKVWTTIWWLCHLLCCCRFQMPLFEVNTTEGESGNGAILTMIDTVDTIPPSTPDVAFNPELLDSPFGLIINLLTVAQSDKIDREARELYTLPIASTYMDDTTYATVSLATSRV